jgi:hypothetical protein
VQVLRFDLALLRHRLVHLVINKRVLEDKYQVEVAVHVGEETRTRLIDGVKNLKDE